MPLLMTYQQWMEDTKSPIKPRSAELKRLDHAIWIKNEAQAKTALVQWIEYQNKNRHDWKKSVRNHRGAVEKLYNQLGILGKAPTFASQTAEIADKAAKVELRKQIQRAAADMFLSREIVFKDSFWGISRQKCRENATKLERSKNNAANFFKSAGGVGVNAAKAALNVRSLASDIHKLVHQTARQAIPTVASVATKNIISENLRATIKNILAGLEGKIQEILAIHVFGKSIEEFVAEVTPFLGVITSGVKATIAWLKLSKELFESAKLPQHRVNIRLGDPSEAMAAMMDVIDRQLKFQAADASIRTAAFTAKGISVGADFGTASTTIIGIIETIAVLLNTLADLVIDARQMAAGNKLIREGKIDLELFNTCPILGCYFLVVQDHSTIMNFEIANMGRENWHLEAQRLRYGIEPVLRKANELVSKSRLVIKGMEQAKGVYKVSLLDKIKLYHRSKGRTPSSNMPGIGGNFDIIEATVKGEI